MIILAPNERIERMGTLLREAARTRRPALRFDAIRKAYKRELGALNDLAQGIEVQVGEDKVHGTKATIFVKPAKGVDAGLIENRVNEILSRYTIRYQIEVA